VDSRTGKVVLVLSAAGYPISQYAIRRSGVPGAAVVELACVGLLARDGSMLAQGTSRMLRRGPAALLWLECATAAVAAASNIRLLADPNPAERVTGRPYSAAEWTRRLATATLFGLHTARFWIYLQPGHGRRR
jgi:hypothetical protein